MEIRVACRDDFEIIAGVHAASIRTGFLSALGVPFLSELYRAIGGQPGACVLVVQEEGRVCGFVAGTTDTGRLYRRVLIRRWYRLIVPLLRFVIFPGALLKMAETVFYGFRKGTSAKCDTSCTAELLSIAVSDSVRGKGLGKELVAELERFFGSQSIRSYKAVTFAEDQKSNAFYRSCSFTLYRQFVHHGNCMNEYVKQIGL